LENYFYLNKDVFNTDGKKISSALTYFKISTSAGEWAQDLQKNALKHMPISFGTWAMFKDNFKRHFIPAHSALEATNAMYTSKMGGRPFNEWYQDWSTYASRSGANEDTQMFAFRKALPMALHQKIMGVSPQPTTLEVLAEKACEFDCLWCMYSNPAFTRNSGPRNCALTTEEDHVQANVALTSCPQMGRKI
jgi:predicted secreted hydrolase